MTPPRACAAASHPGPCGRHRPAWRAALLALAGAAAVGAGQAAEPAPATTAVPRRAAPLGLPAHWQHGAFMEIFVRGYADSDGDGIGDLQGLIGRLDHLKALGIRGIWLMPITASADHDHGYATTDHRGVEAAYGRQADVDELLRQARRRGIGVVMDYVVNHAAAAHPFFVDARANPASPWRDWFVWADTEPRGWDIWGKNPWYLTSTAPWNFSGEPKDIPPAPPGARGFYFGTFGPHMPDFNLRNPAVVDYHLSSLRFWLNRGLAGFRLDAVPHMIENSATDWNDQPESRALTKRLQDEITAYPQRTVVCEATAEPQAYGDPAVCGGAFAFGYTQHFVGATRGQADSVQALASYYRGARPTMATFISNHDSFAGQRLWDQVGGDETRYKLAAAAYLLQPGTPYIYYGEEIGQAGVATLPGDLALRAPMSWTADTRKAGFSTGTPFRPVAPNAATHNAAAQRRDPGSIFHFYRAMLALRNGLPSIARGSFEHSFADGLVLGFQRALGAERTLVLVNYGASAASTRVPGLPPRAGLALAYAGPERAASHPRSPRGQAAALRADADGALTVALPAQSVQVFTVRAAAPR